MPKFILVQGSMSPTARTAVVMRAVTDAFEARGLDADFVDLRDYDLEFCDGRDLSAYNEDAQKLYGILQSGDAYVLSFPIYNYTINAALKNMIEICSGGMSGKVTGIVSNSGGVRSFMASVDLMKMLSYHDNITSVQPTVHTYGADFQDGRIANPKIREKIESMIDALLSFVGDD